LKNTINILTGQQQKIENSNKNKAKDTCALIFLKLAFFSRAYNRCKPEQGQHLGTCSSFGESWFKSGLRLYPQNELAFVLTQLLIKERGRGGAEQAKDRVLENK
jgi:hypothetical protein